MARKPLLLMLRVDAQGHSASTPAVPVPPAVGVFVCSPATRAASLAFIGRSVVEVRERMIGGKMSGAKLEKLLNDHASQGWQLKAITSADVKGRIGPGGTEGLLVSFERRIG